jgi:hypothetical protein
LEPGKMLRLPGKDSAKRMRRKLNKGRARQLPLPDRR